MADMRMGKVDGVKEWQGLVITDIICINNNYCAVSPPDKQIASAIPNWVINSLLGHANYLSRKYFFLLEPHKQLPSWLN